MGQGHAQITRRTFGAGALVLLAGCSGRGNDPATGPGDAARHTASGAAPTRAPTTPGTTGHRPLVEAVRVPPGLPATAPTLFRGVRLFDGDEVRGGVDVLLADGLVAGVGEGLSAPDGAAEVEGRGHTLTPGMIDAHTHVFPGMPEQALRFGVATELDLFGFEERDAVREEEARDGATGRADLFTSMQLATAPGGHGTQFGFQPDTLTDAGEADAWVAARLEEGADYVKVVVESGEGFTALEPTVLRALVEAAHDRELLVFGHAQSVADTGAALDAGVDGLAHVAWDAELPDEEVARIVESGTFVVSTAGFSLATRHKSIVDEARVMDRVHPDAVQAFRGASLARTERWEASLANLGALVDAGATVLAGTDAGNPGTISGAGLLVELEVLVEAGMTPAQALRSATALTADTVGLLDRGRVREGLRADVVLSEGDPTAEILDLRRTVGVWKWGVPVELSLP